GPADRPAFPDGSRRLDGGDGRCSDDGARLGGLRLDHHLRTRWRSTRRREPRLPRVRELHDARIWRCVAREGLADARAADALERYSVIRMVDGGDYPGS